MASNNKRRETTRRQLEQRLQERQQREAARKRAVLIGSVAGTIVVIAVVLILVFTLTGGSDTKKNKKTPSANGGKSCTVVHPKGSVVFDGVTVKNPTDLKTDPDVTSCSSATPKGLEYKDLVVGKGKAATPTSTVKVQYAGVLYKNGTAFDSSWSRGGKPVSFPLTGVVKGFTFGIGGSGTSVPPMKVGGRRVIILPATLGYGSQASGAIPANSSLVFVVDLTATSSASASAPVTSKTPATSANSASAPASSK